MARPVRAAIVGTILLATLATVSGCHTAVDPSPSPTGAASTVTPPPTPTPTPIPTYGPNQAAALATVSKYFDWINTYSKDPSLPNFGELQRLAKDNAVTSNVALVNTLAREGQHQVGDLVLAAMVPDVESPTQIGVSVCVDGSNVIRVDKQGATVPRKDGLTRRVYSLKVRNDGGTWFVVSDLGGNTSC